MNSLKANCSVMDFEERHLKGLMLSCATDNKELWLDRAPVVSGVRHCSVLGTLLFSLHINDIHVLITSDIESGNI